MNTIREELEEDAEDREGWALASETELEPDLELKLYDLLHNVPASSDLAESSAQFLHVIPLNDFFPHVLSQHVCWCHPTIDDENPNLVLHNSADGREDYETGKRKFN